MIKFAVVTSGSDNKAYKNVWKGTNRDRIDCEISRQEYYASAKKIFKRLPLFLSERTARLCNSL